MIRYDLLEEARRFYQKINYESVEVPWMVGKDAYYGTKPSDSEDLYVPAWNSYLAASAEQSFMHLMQTATFPRVWQTEEGVEVLAGKYQAITPCFRDDTPDFFHKPYFMKLELLDFNTENLSSMLSDARVFFLTLDLPTVVEKTEEGLDLVCSSSGIELGSYGVRHWEGFSWVYGTGLALPRATDVKRHKKYIFKPR